MAKSIRVQAFKQGGVPRRRVGEVFDAAADEKTGELRADYATFAKPVDPETPLGRQQPGRVHPPQYTRRKGEYVPVEDRGVSGGGNPSDTSSEDLI